MSGVPSILSVPSTPSILFSIQNNLKQVPEDIQDVLQTRYQELRTYLNVRYDTELRDDSRLAWNYISNPGGLQSLDDVARELWYMKLLYKFTDYPERCKNTLPFINSRIVGENSWFPLADQRAWEHIQNFVLPLLKLECMMDVSKKAGFDACSSL